MRILTAFIFLFWAAYAFAEPTCIKGAHFSVTNTVTGVRVEGCRDKIGLGHGEMRIFNPSGWLIYEGEMVHGRMEGLWLTFNEQGKIIERLTYFHGLRVKIDQDIVGEEDDGGADD